jgi:hypothetical protein
MARLRSLTGISKYVTRFFMSDSIVSEACRVAVKVFRRLCLGKNLAKGNSADRLGLDGDKKANRGIASCFKRIRLKVLADVVGRYIRWAFGWYWNVCTALIGSSILEVLAKLCGIPIACRECAAASNPRADTKNDRKRIVVSGMISPQICQEFQFASPGSFALHRCHRQPHQVLLRSVFTPRILLGQRKQFLLQRFGILEIQQPLMPHAIRRRILER